LKVKGFTVGPQVFGNALGSVELERANDDKNLGLELEALTNSILSCATKVMLECNLGEFFIHFDELDAGLEELDEVRKGMLIGLILAIRGLRREFREMSAPIRPILYLRTDIWEVLNFSDKNKITQGQAEYIDWNSETLKRMINVRLRQKFQIEVTWEDVIDDDLMRGSQPKWNHVIARTLRRPRDVIQFLNIALRIAKKRDDEIVIFGNRDIVNSRDDYSAYLKKELDDEIMPHWQYWEEALSAISTIATETFSIDDFNREYPRRKSDANPLGAPDALKYLHRFSVIGYRKRSGYGGSSWAFMYEDPERGWDSLANQFKAHPGLKEHAGLREGRK